MIYSLEHLWIYVFSHIHITFKSTVSINSNNSNNTGFFLPAVQWIFNSLPVFYSRPSQSLYFPFVYTCVLDWKIIVQPLKLTCILKMFKCHFFNIYKWHTSGMSTDNGGFVGLRHIKINSPPTIILWEQTTILSSTLILSCKKKKQTSHSCITYSMKVLYDIDIPHK